jgi:hypothetical protein
MNAEGRASCTPKMAVWVPRTLFQEVPDLASIEFLDGDVMVSLSRSRLRGRLRFVATARSFALCAPCIARERSHGLLPPALFVRHVGARVAVAPSSLRSRPATACACQKILTHAESTMEAYRFSPAPLIVRGVRKRWGAEGNGDERRY